MKDLKINPWKFTVNVWNRIIKDCLESYPEEACGILLSSLNEPYIISECYPTSNITEENPKTRYLIDPDEFLKVDLLAEEKGLEIRGFYHSHPDHNSHPSQYDIDHAWEGYIYLILSIKRGRISSATLWRLGSGLHI